MNPAFKTSEDTTVEMKTNFYQLSNFLVPKWISLIAFLIQNSILILGIKACSEYSSVIHEYIPGTVVIFSELLKLILSVILCFIFDAKGSFHALTDIFYKAFLEDGSDCMKLCVPAILYSIQNNLQFTIEDAPIFLVLYQAKNLTTVLFYSSMLSRRLPRNEWFSVVALTIGDIMVESSQQEVQAQHTSDFAGVLSVVVACLSSGFAGVYFEKILKTTRSSIWMINIQLSILSTFLCTSLTLMQDTEEIIFGGLFRGFNSTVWIIIVLQAITGLVVATVVKYADSIVKLFCSSVSLTLCFFISSAIFEDATINETFFLGSFLVLSSSIIYISIVRTDTH